MVLAVWAGVSLATDESSLKVAYLYNFAKFIQWPDENRTNLRICVMGNDSLGKSVNDLIGKPVRTMQISVREGVVLQDIPQCDLVFVPAGFKQSLERVRQVANDYPIVIVSESTGTLPSGATVALIPSNNRIVFEVNLTEARKIGLKISAKMLQLAQKVY